VSQETLVIIKPHGMVHREFILGLIQGNGFDLVTSKVLESVDEATIRAHYHDVAERHGPEVLEQLVQQMTEGPLWVGIFDRAEAITVMRELIGSTDPEKAGPGTIRRILREGNESIALSKAEGRAVRNMIHASSSWEDYWREFKVWFQAS
jgi:nucleoside-diphosphate kinase